MVGSSTHRYSSHFPPNQSVQPGGRVSIHIHTHLVLPVVLGPIPPAPLLPARSLRLAVPAPAQVGHPVWWCGTITHKWESKKCQIYNGVDMGNVCMCVWEERKRDIG